MYKKQAKYMRSKCVTYLTYAWHLLFAPLFFVGILYLKIAVDLFSKKATIFYVDVDVDELSDSYRYRVIILITTLRSRAVQDL